MLSIDVARVTAAHLAPLGCPLIVHPKLYGVEGTRDFAWYAMNHPAGFIAIPPPRPLSTQGYMTLWTVTVDAAAKNREAAQGLAYAVQNRMLSLSRAPTPFQFLGDTPVGTSDGGFKFVLTFTAQLRQGE